MAYLTIYLSFPGFPSSAYRSCMCIVIILQKYFISLVYVYWPCILWYKTQWVLRDFDRLVGIFYIDYNVLQIWTVLFLLFQSLYFSFLFWLSVLGRNFSTMLNRSHEQWHSCLVLSLRGKGFSTLYFPLSTVLPDGIL
jgi:hypothetical protein